MLIHHSLSLLILVDLVLLLLLLGISPFLVLLLLSWLPNCKGGARWEAHHELVHKMIYDYQG